MQLSKPAYIVRCRRSGRVIHTQDLSRVAKFCRANEVNAGAANYTISRLPVHAVVAEKRTAKLAGSSHQERLQQIT